MIHRSTHRSLSSVVVAAAAFAMIIGACSNGGASSGAASAPGGTPSAPGSQAGAASPAGIPSGQVTKFQVVQNWSTPGVLDAVWVVAQDKGWYKEAGLDLEFVLPPTPSDPIKFAASGTAPIAFSHSLSSINAAAEGLDFLAVATNIPKSLEQVLCRHDRGLDKGNPKTLEGKTMAQYEDPLPVLYFDLFSQQQGIDKSKMKFVAAGDNGMTVLLAGQSDCVAEGTAGRATYFLATGVDPVNWYYEENGVLPLEWQIIVANREFAEKNPDSVKAFVAQTMRALEYMKLNKDEALGYLFKRYPDLDQKVEGLTFDDTFIKRNATNYSPDKPDGYINPANWENMVNLLVEKGVLKQKIDVSKYVTDQYLPSK